MRKDNRGFSLVELIVVVLIMAIVAVALAPQVMKWVENSRLSKDVETRNSLREQCEIAIADITAFNFVKNGGYTVTMTKNSDGSTDFTYTEEAGTPVTPDPTTNPFWANLLKVCGANDFADFENMFEIKSDPGDDGTITIKVIVYNGGQTIASITGLTGNDDIEVS